MNICISILCGFFFTFLFAKLLNRFENDWAKCFMYLRWYACCSLHKITNYSQQSTNLMLNSFVAAVVEASEVFYESNSISAFFLILFMSRSIFFQFFFHNEKLANAFRRQSTFRISVCSFNLSSSFRLFLTLSLVPSLQYTFSNWMWFFCGAISLNWSISISYWRLDIENHRLDANYIRFKLKLCMHARTVETFYHAIRQTYWVWNETQIYGQQLDKFECHSRNSPHQNYYMWEFVIFVRHTIGWPSK